MLFAGLIHFFNDVFVLFGNGFAFDFHGRCDFAVLCVKFFIQQAELSDVLHAGNLLVDFFHFLGNQLDDFLCAGETGECGVLNFLILRVFDNVFLSMTISAVMYLRRSPMTTASVMYGENFSRFSIY